MSSQKISFADKPWIKNSAWIIAVLSLVITLYASFFYQKSCNLEYEILSNTSILNKNVELSSIKIIVDSIDIQQSNSNISLIEIRISNSGKNHLRREDYDLSEFGLSIQNGTLLEKPELISASTSYLRHCIKEYHFGDNNTFIKIPTIPLDSKDFYQLKLVILHNNTLSLHFEPKGKIIGQKEILVINSIDQEESFLSKLTQGSFLVHICRFICYLVLLGSIFIVVLSISDTIENKKKKKLIQRAYSNKDIDKEIVDDYIKIGWKRLSDMKDYLNTNDKELYTKYQSSLSFISNKRNNRNLEHWYFHMDRANLIKEMLKKGYLKMENEVIISNKKKKKSIELLIDFIRQNNFYIHKFNAIHHFDNKYIDNELL